MPGLGRVPCNKCKYVATSRRMLSRHATVAHSKKVYKCPLCPFVTRYAANWYRHKRDLHGLTKSTTCETCGFFANSTDDLAQHRESEHPEALQLQKYQDKYDKEREKLVVIPENVLPKVNFLPLPQQDDDEVDCDPDESKFSSNENQFGDPSTSVSLPSNGELVVDDGCVSNLQDGLSSGTLVTKNMITPEQDGSVGPMSPLKVRRSYSCESCGLLTTNPREFLYHQRDVHKIKMNVYECNHCVYASKHVQKLQRHCNLVHRPRAIKPDGFPKKVNNRPQKSDKKPHALSLASPSSVPPANISIYDFPTRDLSSSFQGTAAPIKKKSTNPKILHCSACNYQTRNKMLLMHHEKTMHLKKKFFRCLQCGYVTNERSRYVKHVKAHSLPKMKCEFCHYKTAHQWNMDRHMKDHELGGEGEYNCLLCSFMTKNKPSLKTHVTKQHDQSADEVNADGDEEYEEIQMEDFNDPTAEFISPELSWEESHQSDDQGFVSSHNDSLMNSEAGHPDGENSKMFYKRIPPKKTLKCRFCSFKAAWPFQIKKHEETHKTPKKHPCPLCGMRFEHIAWLSKHLSRVHKENSRARELAAALELLKPNRRRSPKISPEQLNSLNSSFQSILRQSDIIQGNAQQSLLSSLLKQPGIISSPSRPNEHASFIDPNIPSHMKAEFSESFSGGYSMMSPLKPMSFPSPQKSDSNLRCCELCGFKTMWVSELEEHMVIHESEESFNCTRCDFQCESKANLNRHMVACHGMKAKNDMIPKLKLKKSVPGKLQMGNSWQSISQEVNSVPKAASQNHRDQESPLDLTTCKSTFPALAETITIVSDDEDMEVIDLSLENNESDALIPVASNTAMSGFTDNAPFVPYNNYYNSDESNNMSLSEGPLEHKASQRRYQCPFCTFNTSTPSRFHVHIVQHYNKRPFMCSECGYRSNYEWDITKHIRIKACKEKTHHNACVLLTDETGRRNYNKYDKYMISVPIAKKVSPLSRINDMVNSKELGDNSARNTFVKELQPDGMFRKASFDGNQPSSDIEGAPVSIVVTPDIDMSFSQELLDNSSPPLEPITDVEQENSIKKDELPIFYCKHCDYKHTSKRLVISHLGIHAGVKPFHCLLCGYSSNWRNNAVKHVKASHNGSVADVENRISYAQEGRVVYLTSVKAGDKQLSFSEQQTSQFGCKLCPYKCDKEFYIKFHMKQHKPREGARFKCDFCPYYVKFKKTLVRHMKLHSENISEPPLVMNTFKENDQNIPPVSAIMEDFSEGAPNYVTSDNYMCLGGEQESFNENETQENGPDEESISINYEQLQASTDDFYDSEIKSKRHICEHCPYNTDNKTQYLYHKQFHRPNVAAPFKCSVCSYWATMQHLITQHMKVHRDDDPEVHYENRTSIVKWDSFDVTKKRSNSCSSDQVQIVYVQRENFSGKMFKCKYCPMMNKKRANVRVHQRMHLTTSNDGKFGCHICSYKCLNQGGLTNHMKIHQADENGISCQMDSIYETSVTNNSVSPLPDVHVKRKKIFSYFCMKCPAVFKSSSDLNTHKYFHGSTLPFSCTHCDYSAKHKPHLYKHLQVHTPEYLAKRDASAGPSVDQMVGTESMDSCQSTDRSNEIVDPLLLQEVAEVKSFLKKGKNASGKMYKCDICPSAFYEITTLSFHASLHGSHGEYGCSQCNYSTVRSANLTAHIQVHSRVLLDGKFIRIFSCPKCPATFKKRSRHEKHLTLHGRNFPFVCEHCDYSVRFAANLCKHRLVHAPPKTPPNEVSPSKVDASICTDQENFDLTNVPSPPSKLQKEALKIPESNEEKKVYICERCPYYQSRKDAVVNHLRRHASNERYTCPFCDYSSFQAFFLRDHIRLHIQPSQLFPPQGFMRHKNFQIWCADGDNRTLVFEDKGANHMIQERFYPAYVPTEDSDANRVLSNSGEESEEDYSLSSEEKRGVIAAKIFEGICSEVFKTTPNSSNFSPEDEPAESNSALPDESDATEYDLIKDLKVELIDIIKERKRLDKVVPPTDLFLINKFLKKWRKARQNRIKKHKSSKLNSGIRSLKPKLTVNQVCNEDGSQKSGLVMKIKVEKAEKLRESCVYRGSENDYSDAASDITIPADDLENYSSEVDPEQSSIANNLVGVNLGKCSVTVEPLNTDLEQQSDFCDLLEPLESDSMEVDSNNSNSFLPQLKMASICSFIDPVLNGCHSSLEPNDELMLQVPMEGL